MNELTRWKALRADGTGDGERAVTGGFEQPCLRCYLSLGHPARNAFQRVDLPIRPGLLLAFALSCSPVTSKEAATL